MKTTRVVAALALVAPLVAAAQVSYPLATEPGERVYYYRESPRICHDRNASLWERKAALDADQRDVDRAGAQLERMKARLDGEYRNLDFGNNAAIAAYNARSDEYNRLIQDHNRRVARMNGAAAVLNGDSADLASFCDGIVVLR